MGMKLFDDAGDDVEDISKIEIDRGFAKRFEYNKKREDLQKLEEMKKKGLIDDSGSNSETSSDDSDEEDDMNSKEKEKKFFDALLKIRKKDPILKEENVKLFESSSDDDDDDDGDGGEEGGERKKKKAKYLKDVIAEHLIEKGPEFADDDDDEEREREENKRMKKVRSYAEEQEDLRKEVLEAMAAEEREAEGKEGEFLKEKQRGEVSEGDEEFHQLLDEYFGNDDNLDENDKFLKDFFDNKLWKKKDKEIDFGEDGLAGLSDDEEALEKQEDYERDYNFRYEENASDRVLGHSRVVAGSVRKEANARKQQRERKKERIAQAELERQEEVKRLKNLKKKEIQEKLNKIREIAGFGGDGVPLTEDDLEEDFNPDEYDKKMKDTFGDDYYEAEDNDLEIGDDGESDLEKPDFEKEDRLLGLPEDWDVIKSSDGFLAERERILKCKVDKKEEEEAGDEGDDDEQLQNEEGKRKRKRKMSLKEKVALDKEFEELYKLDHEGTIGDLKTRFKYKPVAPRRYGLSTAHILLTDEKELNQYIPLKKIAPYREKEHVVNRRQRHTFMAKKGGLLQGLFNGQNNQKRKREKHGGDRGETSGGKGSNASADVKAQEEQPSKDESKLSRRARRRRQQKEHKMAQSRRMAYGLITSSSKKKSKS